MPAYSLLSDIEREKKQFGRAETLLVLGLKFDKQNKDLAVKLQAFRAEFDPELQPQQNVDDDTADLFDCLFQSPICFFILFGDGLSLNEIWHPEFVHQRFGNVPLMHLPIYGNNIDLNVEKAKKMIDCLFEKGVRLDARDRLGNTALILAADPSLNGELLAHLLQKGADPDIRAFDGTTALTRVVIAKRIVEAETLLTHGADPYIVDNDGSSAYKEATRYKDMFALFDKHLHPKLPVRVCHVCGKKGQKRCKTCRVAVYCSETCQRADWLSHKKKCKKLVKGHKRLAICKNTGESWFLTTNSAEAVRTERLNQFLPASHQVQMPKIGFGLYSTDELYQLYESEYNRKGNLLLKLQAAIDESKNQINDDYPLTAYNEDRKFLCRLDPNALDAAEVKAILVERGGFVFKAYFWAFMERGSNELVILTEPRLPAQTW